MAAVSPDAMQVTPKRRLVLAAIAFVGLLVLVFSRPWAGFEHRATSASALTSGVKVLPPASGIYHAAFPDFGGTEDRVTATKIANFQALTGKPIAWSYFSNNWMDGLTFPLANVTAAHNAGTVPFIRMMPRSNWNEGGPDPVFTMAAINAGAFDAQLAQWARDAEAVGYPLMVEFGTEVNGDWFSWNGKYNGGPGVGPAAFQSAYRRIIDIFRAQGVANITWVFHVDAQASPEQSWNAMANYYPGDDYIDWLGISAYGPQTPTEDWQEFTQVMDAGYAELAALSPSKPIALLEFSVTDGYPGHSKADWETKAFSAIRSGRYPRLKAISWWHENFSNDDGTQSLLRVDTSPAALDAYKAALADPLFTSAVVTSAATAPTVVATAPAATSTPIPTIAVATTVTSTPTAAPTMLAAATSSPVATATVLATSTPLSQAPAAPTAAPFADDFESYAVGTTWGAGAAVGRWLATNNGGGTTSIEADGTRTLSLWPAQSATAGDSHMAFVQSAATFTDVDFTVRVKTVAQTRATANPWETGWVLWGIGDAQHSYYVALKTNGIEVGKQDPAYAGGKRYLATAKNPSFRVGRWYTIRVRQSAGVITVWVDGAVAAKFTDTERPYATGAIGLLAADAHVRFDSVAVK